MSSFFKFVARLLFAALFILSGISKLLDPSAVEQYMVSKGLMYAHPLLYIAAISELVGGVFLLIGLWPRFIATLLTIYLIIVTFTMHNFWALPAPESAIQIVEFLKNLGIIGGLLYIIASGGGQWAVTKEKPTI